MNRRSVFAAATALLIGCFSMTAAAADPNVAVLSQPSEQNEFTVTAAGEPVSYQWYRVEEQEIPVTDQNAQTDFSSIVGSSRAQSNYAPRAGWTGCRVYTLSEFLYFSTELRQGDVLRITAEDGRYNISSLYLLGESDMSLEIYSHSDGEDFLCPIDTDAEYLLFVYPKEINDEIPLLSAVIERTERLLLGGETNKQLQTTTPGSYCCQITYADGSSLLSDTVSFAFRKAPASVQQEAVPPAPAASSAPAAPKPSAPPTVSAAPKPVPEQPSQAVSSIIPVPEEKAPSPITTVIAVVITALLVAVLICRRYWNILFERA